MIYRVELFHPTQRRETLCRYACEDRGDLIEIVGVGDHIIYIYIY